MAKFIYNHDGTKLINLAHVITLSLESPCLAQKNWTVVARLSYGTEILISGGEYDCRVYLGKIHTEMGVQFEQ